MIYLAEFGRPVANDVDNSDNRYTKRQKQRYGPATEIPEQRKRIVQVRCILYVRQYEHHYELQHTSQWSGLKTYLRVTNSCGSSCRLPPPKNRS